MLVVLRPEVGDKGSLVAEIALARVESSAIEGA
jgi:hypothetical protein